MVSYTEINQPTMEVIVFDVYSGSILVLSGFKTLGDAEAYVKEWKFKAGRSDLHVVVNEGE